MSLPKQHLGLEYKAAKAAADTKDIFEGTSCICCDYNARIVARFHACQAREQAREAREQAHQLILALVLCLIILFISDCLLRRANDMLMIKMHTGKRLRKEQSNSSMPLYYQEATSCQRSLKVMTKLSDVLLFIAMDQYVHLPSAVANWRC